MNMQILSKREMKREMTNQVNKVKTRLFEELDSLRRRILKLEEENKALRKLIC